MTVDSQGFNAGVAIGLLTVVGGVVALWYLGVRKAVIARGAIEAGKAVVGELAHIGITGALATEASAQVQMATVKALEGALP